MEGKLLSLSFTLMHVHMTPILIHFIPLNNVCSDRYYFDVDLFVVHPFVANSVNEFVTVKWYDYNKDPEFFQAFIAASPKNKIIKRSLDIMVEILSGKRSKRGVGFLGTQSMQDAWAEIEQEDPSVASHGKDKKVYLLTEHNMRFDIDGFANIPRQQNRGPPLFSEGGCDFFVADEDEKSFYFYSRTLGTRDCGQLHLLQSPVRA